MPPLTRAQRVERAVLALTLAVLFLGRTTIGDDHWWPFSPWRMYATSTGPNTAVASTLIEIRTAADPATWVPAPLTPANVGLNGAEVEGRLDLIKGDPSVLGTLAASHARLRPEQDPWIGIRVVIRRFLLKDGALTGESRDETVAEWTSRGRARHDFVVVSRRAARTPRGLPDGDLPVRRPRRPVVAHQRLVPRLCRPRLVSATDRG
ncbi:conserved hypothetical protein [Nostocoides jenkinsii Ben 74]|uniref:Uncharacterized protein n=1 Tax=Nostocoides jenkinsii Ben 74 TaxID=1193518 RepID=A0A077MCW7_9MICO|nr:conserved hypothetical protein [Tetrasphaera jenkinsii Ben 74]